MQLPQDLQPHFATAPTLLVIGDHVLAHLYLVAGNAIEEVHAVAMPRERMTDKQDSFVAGGSTGSVGESESHAEDDRLHKFVTQVAESMKDAVASGSATRFLLAMEADLAHAVKAALPSDLQGHVFREVHLNLVKESPVDVIKRCLAA